MTRLTQRGSDEFIVQLEEALNERDRAGIAYTVDTGDGEKAVTRHGVGWLEVVPKTADGPVTIVRTVLCKHVTIHDC